MKLSLGKKTIEVAHPVHPEVVAVFKRGSNIERMILSQRVAEQLGEEGNLEAMLQTIEDGLQGRFQSISGIEDYDGSGIGQMDAQAFHAFFDDVLMDGALSVPAKVKVKEKRPIHSNDPEGGQVDVDVDVEKDVQLWYPVWLAQEINKPSRWAPDLDPKESQRQSTSSGETPLPSAATAA